MKSGLGIYGKPEILPYQQATKHMDAARGQDNPGLETKDSLLLKQCQYQ